jgi:hypothetical protein
MSDEHGLGGGTGGGQTVLSRLLEDEMRGRYPTFETGSSRSTGGSCTQ